MHFMQYCFIIMTFKQMRCTAQQVERLNGVAFIVAFTFSNLQRLHGTPQNTVMQKRPV